MGTLKPPETGSFNELAKNYHSSNPKDTNSSQIEAMSRFLANKSRQSLTVLNKNTMNKLAEFFNNNQDTTPSKESDSQNSTHWPEVSGVIDNLRHLSKSSKRTQFNNADVSRTEFLDKLGNVISNLKEVDTSPKMRQSDLYSLLTSDCFLWKGELDTLGKQEPFIVQNLFVLKDRFEGVYRDDGGINYELAGSFSPRTHEFEIIGISLGKDRSFKFKGSLEEDFTLSGEITHRPSIRPPSNLHLKLLGVICEANIINKVNHAQSHKGVTCLYKKTSTLLYVMLRIGKGFVFGSGVKDEETNVFSLELSFKEKKFRTELFVQSQRDLQDLNSKNLRFNSQLHFLEILVTK